MIGGETPAEEARRLLGQISGGMGKLEELPGGDGGLAGLIGELVKLDKDGAKDGVEADGVG